MGQIRLSTTQIGAPLSGWLRLAIEQDGVAKEANRYDKERHQAAQTGGHGEHANDRGEERAGRDQRLASRVVMCQSSSPDCLRASPPNQKA